MKIRQLNIRNFRGFEELVIVPRGHVFLVGQPGAGRSDVVEALCRVLTPDSTRGALTDDLDFHKRKRAERVEIEVVLGDLGEHLSQLFLDRLEFWYAQADELVEEIGPGDNYNDTDLEPALRLCYRAEWDDSQQQAEHWVDFPKSTNLDAGTIARVPRLLRQQLPFTCVQKGAHLLSLSARGDLRRLVDAEDSGDLGESLDQLVEGVAALAENLHSSNDLTSVLARVLEPLRVPLNLGGRSAEEVIRFAPDGGSLAGILRGLAPTVKLRDELGFVPIEKHGSTLSGMFELARAVAQTESSAAIVVIDDFAEAVDPLAAQHLASVLRTQASQLWLSSRSGVLGEVFRPDELVRLTISHEGDRGVFAGPVPSSKAERIAARSLHHQILPAVSARAVLILEGPHDRAAIQAASLRLNSEQGEPLLAARRIAAVDAGSADGSGGLGAIPKIGQLARKLGFFVIALIDWDRKEDEAQRRLELVQNAVDVVVRWPKGVAVERALLQGLDDEGIRSTLLCLAEASATDLGFCPEDDSGPALRRKAEKFLKSAGGLHASFIEALPGGLFPELLRSALIEVREAVSKSGLVQL